jgi:hypothetical protein
LPRRWCGKRPLSPPLRLWFEAATQDEASDRDGNGVIDAIQDTLELIAELKVLGFAPDEEVVYVEVPGGRHNYDTWAECFPPLSALGIWQRKYVIGRKFFKINEREICQLLE